MNHIAVDWAGTWVNEYGSRLVISDVGVDRIEGTFTTALGDSTFAGTTTAIHGLHKGNCLHFAFGHAGAIASFTGLLRADGLHMAWHVVSDRGVKRPHPAADPTEIELPWAHAVLANTDTFLRQPN